MARFTVDTHLFRELGELLVGRDSTALIELIKNAYDADANEVIVYAEALDNAGRGFIRIKDNGLGMTPAIFEDGFLRIASRVKDQGDRTSVKYGRRYTGAKGIGRLAAHKLARDLQVTSIPDREHLQDAREGIEAVIHWDQVEKYETLESLDESKDPSAISVESKNIGGASKSGTTITLSRLRRKWTLKERGRFIEEIQTFTPPEVLIRVPKSVVPSSLLFEEPLLRASSRSKDAFSTKLQGEFAPGEDYWQALSQAADWIVEIDTSIDARRVKYNIAPTKTFLADSPEAKPSRLTIDHPYPDSKLSFQARILVKEGSSGTKPMKAWAGNAYGIRVFLEGFRVLPYGEKSNDWLSLDLDYAQRTRKSVWLEAVSLEDESSDEDALLVHLPNRSYFGGIFLTVEGAHCLRMLVNREGFVPDSMTH
jgi:Histidine kinase-, DNA gyrase B-, and HSP90-like ATPase